MSVRPAVLKAFAVLGIACLAACQANVRQDAAPFHAVPALGAGVAAKSDTRNLYVANATTVTVYASGNYSLLRAISGIAPSALAFDKHGNLYVADLGRGAPPVVRVYAAKTSTTLREISYDVSVPRALAFDASGSLYVANDYLGVVGYAPNSGTKVSRLLKVFYPLCMTFDANDNLFVSNTTGPYGGGEPDGVEEFAPGLTVHTRFITKGVGLPVALITDASGNLYVANQNQNNVTVYAPGTKTVLRTIHEGVTIPRALALDDSGSLYVANSESNTVTVYAPGSSSVLRTIREGVVEPTALAFDDAGNLFVANAHSVTMYAPNTTAVLRTITKGVSMPVALGFGP